MSQIEKLFSTQCVDSQQIKNVLYQCENPNGHYDMEEKTQRIKICQCGSMVCNRCIVSNHTKCVVCTEEKPEDILHKNHGHDLYYSIGCKHNYMNVQYMCADCGALLCRSSVAYGIIPGKNVKVKCRWSCEELKAKTAKYIFSFQKN